MQILVPISALGAQFSSVTPGDLNWEWNRSASDKCRNQFLTKIIMEYIQFFSIFILTKLSFFVFLENLNNILSYVQRIFECFSFKSIFKYHSKSIFYGCQPIFIECSLYPFLIKIWLSKPFNSPCNSFLYCNKHCEASSW